MHVGQGWVHVDDGIGSNAALMQMDGRSIAQEQGACDGDGAIIRAMDNGRGNQW